MSGRIAIGVGCRRDCPAAAVAALVSRAIALCTGAGPPAGLYTLADKADEPGLRQAAALLGLPLTPLPAAALREVEHRIATPSAAAQERFGLPSVSEAAALAGAGAGARLLLARITGGGATCAVAIGDEDPA